MTDSHSKHAQADAATVYDRTLDRASHALESSRDVVADAAHRAAKGAESNPLGILVGGIAVGALIGALIPRSAKEKELLAPIGKRLGETAKAAVGAARAAGKDELDALGLTPAAARNQAKSLLDGVLQAVATAGSAAAKTATNKSATDKPT